MRFISSNLRRVKREKEEFRWLGGLLILEQGLRQPESQSPTLCHKGLEPCHVHMLASFSHQHHHPPP